MHALEYTFNLYSQVWRHGLARAIIVDSVRESEYKQYDYLKGQMNWKKIATMTRGSHYIHHFMVLNILYQLSYNTQRKLIIRHRNRQVFSCTRQTLKKKHNKKRPYVIDTWLTSILKREVIFKFFCISVISSVYMWLAGKYVSMKQLGLITMCRKILNVCHDNFFLTYCNVHMLQVQWGSRDSSLSASQRASSECFEWRKEWVNEWMCTQSSEG